MTSTGLLDARLRHQCLRDTPHTTPQQVVAWMGAVQAQDYPGAAWALALRASGLTLAAVDRALAAGRILRTHVLRPTWHLVAPADIRWMLALTGPRVQALMRTYDRRLELDAQAQDYPGAAWALALRASGRIAATGQRLAHIVMHAELDGAICSGPRSGSQFTYALLAERAPKARTLPRDAALAALAFRYYRSHGPATVRDFAWWSDLTMADARAGASAAAPAGQVLPEPPALARASGADYLLPNYDEYLIAYRDRGAVLDPARARNLGMFTRLEYPHQAIVEGRVAGSWKRTVTGGSAQVSLRWHQMPAPRHRASLAAEAARFGRFLGLACGVDHEAPAP